MIAVDTADFEAASSAFSRARCVVSGLPPRLLVGRHDTHAAGLDAALDGFAHQAEAAAGALLVRIEMLGVSMGLAARGFTAVELGLVRAMAP